MLAAQKFSWSRQENHHKKLYYEVFHANKNCYVDGVHVPTVDTYTCLGLSDEFSKELGRTHRLGNLNVNQSPKCLAEMNKLNHVREKHTDLTGGDCARLLSEKCTLAEPIDGISETFAALRPMAVAAVDPMRKLGPASDARKCFRVFHKIYTLFAAAQHLRLTIHTHGDQSALHQEYVRQYFDCLMDDVNSKLVKNMKAGLTYMSWPMHFVAEHLSYDMAAWAAWTGGLPFGRSSNQVTEHMNKVIKRFLRRHTNMGLSFTNMDNSKFKQLLIRVAAERLRRGEVEVVLLRKKTPCSACVKRGIVLGITNMHHRRTSKLCNSIDYIEPQKKCKGRVLSSSASARSPLRSESSSSSSSSDSD